MNAALMLLRTELLISARQGFDIVMIAGFFLLVAVVFVLGVGPGPRTLALIAPGILWTSALLAALLSLDRLFQSDWEAGTLEILCLSTAPLELLVLAKSAAHWLASGLPVLVLAPFVAEILQLEQGAWLGLIAGLTLGTLAISLIGTVCAALALGAQRSGLLLAILMLPLAAPILIFGAASAAPLNSTTFSMLGLLGGILSIALPLAPIAGAAALRTSVACR